MHGNPMSGVAQLTSNGRPASAEAPLALDSGEALSTEDNGARPGDRRGAEAALGSDQDPWVGRVIDERYRLEALLGEGSTGRVYRARQERTDRLVAVKLLHDHLSRDEASVRRFQREARVACRINHHNAITIHDCGVTSDGRCYLVTELIDGETLREVLDREGLLTTERALALFRGIVAGVAAAHDKGVVHRELHPGNIFICRDSSSAPGGSAVSQSGGAARAEEHVKVFDFGGARLTVDERDSDVTGSGHLDLEHLLWHIRYLPPERLQRDFRPDPRGDVYALGLILFELCTGVYPYEAVDPLVVMAMHLQTPPPLLRESRPSRWFAPALQGLLTQLLAKDPEQRPADACEVARRLQHVEEMGALMADRPASEADPEDMELELEMEALPADEAGGPRGGAVQLPAQVTVDDQAALDVFFEEATLVDFGPRPPRAEASAAPRGRTQETEPAAPPRGEQPPAVSAPVRAAASAAVSAPVRAAASAVVSAPAGSPAAALPAAAPTARAKPSWVPVAVSPPPQEAPPAPPSAPLPAPAAAPPEPEDSAPAAEPSAAERLGQIVIALCYLFGSAALVFCLGVLGFRFYQAQKPQPASTAPAR